MEQLIEKFTKEINDKFFYFEETINYLKNKIQSLIDEFHNEKKELKEENQKLREEITSYQYQNFSYLENINYFFKNVINLSLVEFKAIIKQSIPSILFSAIRSFAKRLIPVSIFP